MSTLAPPVALVATAKLLRDALDIVDGIIAATAGKTLEAYEANQKMRLVIERRLEIIGECFDRLQQSEPEMAASIPALRSIIVLRNIIAELYDALDHVRIWNVTQQDIPPLRAVLVALLDKVPGDE